MSAEQDPDVRAHLEFLHGWANAPPARRDICVASWSALPDDLSQWRAYSGIGTGYSIGLSGGSIESLAKSAGGFLAQCVYDPNVQTMMMNAIIDHCLSLTHGPPTFDHELEWPEQTDFNWLLVKYAVMLKHPAFAAEREWRIISEQPRGEKAHFRAGKSTLRSYRPISLASSANGTIDAHSVHVGPCPHPDLAKEKVLYLLRTHTNQNVPTPVISSSVP